MRYYPALVVRDTEGCAILFPDFPECDCLATDEQSAMEMAENQLNAHISKLMAENGAIPSPTSLEDIDYDPDLDEISRLMIKVDHLPPPEEI